jgi:hypothetical protein
MKGRKPDEYKLKAKDRRYLNGIATEGQLIQRVAKRACALLALDRGERIVEILHWLGMSRAGLWYLWQRYLERGVEAIFDAERSGRPAIFSPAGTGSD